MKKFFKSIFGYVKTVFEYVKVFFKWLLIAAFVGAVGGITGVLLHFCVDGVTELREENSYLIYFLPLGGLLIVALYRAFRSMGRLDTNRVIEAARENIKVPFVTVPLIFVSTVITHLFGGSAGREGAALQIGGGIGYNIGKLFKFGENDIHIITMAGMSSVFAALFGTPVTAAIFSLEVISVGVLNYAGLLPCVIASASAYHISRFCGIAPMHFDSIDFAPATAGVVAKVAIIALCGAVLSIVFCKSVKKCDLYMDKLFHNSYLRVFVGGVIVVLLTLAVGTRDYNGAGMDVVARALSGEARVWDFALKIIFTAVTIAAGFKGGEIIPSLFIGSTFGCVLANIIGLDPGFGAAVGMIALFCGVVNCPVASVFLAIELFGTQGILYFAIICAISYLMSGYAGLYNSQKIVYSKLSADYIDTNAN